MTKFAFNFTINMGVYIENFDSDVIVLSNTISDIIINRKAPETELIKRYYYNDININEHALKLNHVFVNFRYYNTFINELNQNVNIPGKITSLKNINLNSYYDSSVRYVELILDEYSDLLKHSTLYNEFLKIDDSLNINALSEYLNTKFYESNGIEYSEFNIYDVIRICILSDRKYIASNPFEKIDEKIYDRFDKIIADIVYLQCFDIGKLITYFSGMKRLYYIDDSDLDVNKEDKNN